MQKQRYLHIPKPLFIAHKKEFKTFLDTRLFTIASLYWEHETHINDIAREYEVSGTRIRQLLWKARERIKENKYRI
ncbi:hypothetical protein GCM10011344_27090 [Dokdonia pacifica]|uniref:Sigma-70, region 4 n=1 Tax=Dokdonia pacifica TaxID=1627892 RepID=A0A239E7V5_9FLAO|nr:hypothetical protein [Dokdonia pacifica]GGG25009.1 hypothetical protein GCM10011344_27090 [Dokdonia pacifica]SNS40368.1 hypothetical protein SAMN06265376_11435 [Dokdonia pacifica]